MKRKILESWRAVFSKRVKNDMENLVHEVIMLHKARLDLENKLNETKAKLDDAIKVFIAEACIMDKKFALPGSEFELYAKDYKVFDPATELLLKQEKTNLKLKTKPFEDEAKAKEAEIKRQAERAGSVSVDRRWYVRKQGEKRTGEFDD